MSWYPAEQSAKVRLIRNGDDGLHGIVLMRAQQEVNHIQFNVGGICLEVTMSRDRQVTVREEPVFFYGTLKDLDRNYSECTPKGLVAWLRKDYLDKVVGGKQDVLLRSHFEIPLENLELEDSQVHLVRGLVSGAMRTLPKRVKRTKLAQYTPEDTKFERALIILPNYFAKQAKETGYIFGLNLKKLS